MNYSYFSSCGNKHHPFFFRSFFCFNFISLFFFSYLNILPSSPPFRKVKSLVYLIYVLLINFQYAYLAIYLYKEYSWILNFHKYHCVINMMLVLIFLTLNLKNMSYVALGELTLLFLSGAQFPLCPLSPLAHTHMICNNYSNQLLRHVLPFATPWTATCQASLSITNSCSLLKLMAFELVMPSNHLIHCCPLLFLLSIFPSAGTSRQREQVPIATARKPEKKANRGREDWNAL